MKQQKWPTRGSRISRNGFRVVWAAFGLLLVFLLAQAAKPPMPVDFALLGLMFAVALAGLVIVFRGNQIDHRDLADHYHRVAAGEEPEPARQAAAAGTAEQRSGLETGLAAQAARQRQAEATTALTELEKGRRRSWQLVGTVLGSCACLWAAAISFFLAVTGPHLNAVGLVATAVFLVLCVWSAVAAVRMQMAEHRRRHGHV